MLIVVNLHVEAGKVEAVGQIFFVNLAEVLIATGRNELEVKSQLCVLTGFSNV